MAAAAAIASSLPALSLTHPPTRTKTKIVDLEIF
jgi:hypothetical protein